MDATLNFSLEKLKPVFKNWMREVIEEMPSRNEPKHSSREELMSRKQALEFFGVTSATLWRWEKDGKVKSHGIGSKRYYKRSELEESLIEKK